MSATGRSKYLDVAALAALVQEDVVADAPKQKKHAKTPEDLRALAAEKIVARLGGDIPLVHVIRVLEVVGQKTKRSRGDFYETPAWCIAEIIPHLTELGIEPLIVDAGAGNGAISVCMSDAFPRGEIVGVEKFPELVTQARARCIRNAEFVQGNFLKWEPEIGRPDLVIMNPPFSMAMQFVEQALRIVKRGGTVAALLRLGWLESKDRFEFLKKHAPDVFVLSRRPSFTGKGTDATAYAWMIWSPKATGRVKFLACSQKTKRKNAERKTPAAAEARGRDVAQVQGPT